MSDLGELLHERYGDRDYRHEALWNALMVCQDCPHRMIEHDEVAMRCTKCRCDQRDRGLSSWADERLIALGQALHEYAKLARREPHPEKQPDGTVLWRDENGKIVGGPA